MSLKIGQRKVLEDVFSYPISQGRIALEFDWGQCDQIGRFIGLWTRFRSLWQQLICPTLPHSQAIFVKMSKSIIFLVKSFLATFIDIWRFFSGHTVHHVPSFFNSLRTAKCTLVQLSEVRIIEIHKFQLSLTFSIFKERKEIHFFSFLLFESSVGRPWSPWV